VTGPTTTRRRGRPKKGAGLDHAAIRQMRDDGMTVTQIATTIGASTSSVSYICSKPAAPRPRPRLLLDGAPLPCTDERWHELQAWWARRLRGEGYRVERVQLRRTTMRASTR
jgi:hypothetical protein